MQRKFRLTRSEDFKRVRRFGKSYAHPLVVLMVLKNETNDQPQVRVGVTAGRMTGTAVVRNRAKRLLREAMRTLLQNIDFQKNNASNLDLVLVVRPGLASATLAEIQQALEDLLHRAQIVISIR